MRIVFFGTPEIAVPTLENLIAGPHDVVGVVSQPDRPRGRGRKLSASPVSEVALRESVPLVRPEKVGEPEVCDAIEAWAADLGVVVAFGQFLPKRIRELPSKGYLINAHASLLPSYRGASPIAQAILDGQPETGISVMRVDREMDAGPVALERRLPIFSMENTAELSERLSRLAAEAIAESVDAIADGTLSFVAQDHAAATIAPKLGKADTPLDWNDTARRLQRRVHGLAPRPGAVGHFASPDDSGDGEPLRILRAEVSDQDAAIPDAPGTVRRCSDGSAPLVRIATGRGWLVPLEIQRAGGKAMPIDAFLRGHDLQDGGRFLAVPSASPAAKGSVHE